MRAIAQSYGRRTVKGKRRPSAQFSLPVAVGFTAGWRAPCTNRQRPGKLVALEFGQFGSFHRKLGAVKSLGNRLAHCLHSSRTHFAGPFQGPSAAEIEPAAPYPLTPTGLSIFTLAATSLQGMDRHDPSSQPQPQPKPADNIIRVLASSTRGWKSRIRGRVVGRLRKAELTQ
jgi:hypothetical protein